MTRVYRITQEQSMARRVSISLEMPGDLGRLRLPRGVNDRLQHLLDRQCESGKLSRAERAEAEGLVNLAELLSLLRLRAEGANRKKKRDS
jgi:hypothetical protein